MNKTSTTQANYHINNKNMDGKRTNVIWLVSLVYSRIVKVVGWMELQKAK